MDSKPKITPKTDLNRSDHETELASGKKMAINVLKKYFKSDPNGYFLNAPKLALLRLLYADLCIFL
jgi:hypothetical protein